MVVLSRSTPLSFCFGTVKSFRANFQLLRVLSPGSPMRFECVGDLSTELAYGSHSGCALSDAATLHGTIFADVVHGRSWYLTRA